MTVAMLADAVPLRYLAEVKKPAVSVAPWHTQDQTVRAHACRMRRVVVYCASVMQDAMPCYGTCWVSSMATC